MTEPQNSRKLLPLERKAVISLSLIYAVRMLGLFIIFPVFSLVAQEYPGASPILVGFALGVYGLLQALLQIPFGMLSDRYGRKPVILVGLALLLVGSIVAALAETITGLIVGRALQGAGALSAALIALAADLTRDEQRTKVMALLGSSIGFAFLLSMIIGPLLVQWFSLSGLFWLTAICTVVAMGLLWKSVPNPTAIKISGDTVARSRGLIELIRDPQLLRLDASIFFLHMLVTGLFVGVPLLLTDVGFELADHWQVYVPVLLASIVIMVPAIIVAERHRKSRRILLLAIVGIGFSQLILMVGADYRWLVFVGLALFFGCFNTMEALLPSLVSRMAPPGTKGSAMGVYSTCQFSGAFIGGAGGGWIYGQFGVAGLFLALAVVCALWFGVSFGQKPPIGISTHIHPVGKLSPSQITQWSNACLSVPGVQDAVVMGDEGVAYLKVDRQRFSSDSLPPVPG